MSHNRSFRNLFCLLLITGISTACGTVEEEVATDTTDNNGNPTVGAVDDDAGLYVRVFDTDDYEYFIHEDGSFTEGCKIDSVADSTSIADKKIDCIIEAPEGDLFFHGVSMQFNVPTDMCTYFAHKPFYYYGYRPGVGASNLTAYIGLGGVIGGLDTNSDGDFGDGGELTEPQVDGADDSTISYTNFTGTTPVCAYNYTASDGPNCCEGLFTYTLYSFSEDTGSGAPGYLAPAITVGDWGGSRQECFRGPANQTQEKDTAGNILHDLFFVEGSGLNDKYDVESPLSFAFFGSNLHASNYIEAADYTNNGSGGNVVGAADIGVPLAFHPQEDPKTTADFAGGTQATYQYECLDEGFEVLGSINLTVREWNTIDNYDILTTGSNPDLAGAETNYASDETSYFDNNDLRDWKDFDGFPGGG